MSNYASGWNGGKLINQITRVTSVCCQERQVLALSNNIPILSMKLVNYQKLNISIGWKAYVSVLDK
jgi:hypothetical protein